MFCKACGQGIDRSDKFCRSCGVPLPQEPVEAAAAAGASASTPGEAPVVAVASSTAELQRPLPIPKALVSEAPAAPAAGNGAAAAAVAPAISADNPQAAVAPVEPPQEKQPQPSEAPVPQPASTASSTPEVQAALQPASAAAPTSEVQAAQRAEVAPKVEPTPQVEAAPSAVPQPSVTATTQDSAKPDSPDRGSRPVRLCPQCHRLVGDDDMFCQRCGAKLEVDQPTPSPAPPVEESLGVPSFAGYAAEPAAKRSAEDVAVPLSDPSGVDAIANLRVRKRRGLSVLEIIVAVILLAGAAMAVWMLRSSQPNKTATSALNVNVTISPARAKVIAGHGYDFAATVTGADNYNVEWSIDEGDNAGRIVPRGAKASGGAVSSLAVYVAPKTPGTYHVTATSKADAAESATATITVTGK